MLKNIKKHSNSSRKKVIPLEVTPLITKEDGKQKPKITSIPLKKLAT
jgi:hypothetical protein